MKRSNALLLLLALLVFVGLLLHQGGIVNAVVVSPLDKLKWGVLLQTQSPFYSVGDTATALYALYNRSAEDAYGWSSQGGGNGCEYAFTIVNQNGEVVWEPGSIVGGQFFPPICTDAIVPKDLPAGSKINNSLQIPLVYQNGGGIGTLGDPLPAGFYSVRVEVEFHGPHRVQGTIELGLSHSASVPIQIEP